MSISKEEVVNILKHHVVNLSFEKKDKTVRNMKCTLKESEIPIENLKSSKQNKNENQEIVPVWDVEKQAFRCFRINSLIQYSVAT